MVRPLPSRGQGARGARTRRWSPPTRPSSPARDEPGLEPARPRLPGREAVDRGSGGARRAPAPGTRNGTRSGSPVVAGRRRSSRRRAPGATRARRPRGGNSSGSSKQPRVPWAVLLPPPEAAPPRADLDATRPASARGSEVCRSAAARRETLEIERGWPARSRRREPRQRVDPRLRARVAQRSGSRARRPRASPRWRRLRAASPVQRARGARSPAPGAGGGAPSRGAAPKRELHIGRPREHVAGRRPGDRGVTTARGASSVTQVRARVGDRLRRETGGCVGLRSPRGPGPPPRAGPWARGGPDLTPPVPRDIDTTSRPPSTFALSAKASWKRVRRGVVGLAESRRTIAVSDEHRRKKSNRDVAEGRVEGERTVHLGAEDWRGSSSRVRRWRAPPPVHARGVDHAVERAEARQRGRERGPARLRDRPTSASRNEDLGSGGLELEETPRARAAARRSPGAPRAPATSSRGGSPRRPASTRRAPKAFARWFARVDTDAAEAACDQVHTARAVARATSGRRRRRQRLMDQDETGRAAAEGQKAARDSPRGSRGRARRGHRARSSSGRPRSRSVAASAGYSAGSTRIRPGEGRQRGAATSPPPALVAPAVSRVSAALPASARAEGLDERDRGEVSERQRPVDAREPGRGVERERRDDVGPSALDGGEHPFDVLAAPPDRRGSIPPPCAGSPPPATTRTAPAPRRSSERARPLASSAGEHHEALAKLRRRAPRGRGGATAWRRAIRGARPGRARIAGPAAITRSCIVRGLCPAAPESVRRSARETRARERRGRLFRTA